MTVHDDAQAAAPTEEQTSAERQPGTLTRIRRWFYKTAAEREQEHSVRVRQLSVLLELYPADAALYLARGEAFWKRGDRELAREDLRNALHFAEHDITHKRWGLVDQAVADRARQRLKEVESLSAANEQ